MSIKHLIAIDVGVSLIKVGVYDEDGRVMAVATRPAPARQPAPGTFIQSPDELYDITRDTLRRAVLESGVPKASVAAIAVSGAMGGAMGVDAHWRPVTEWSIVSDTRFMNCAQSMLQAAHGTILTRSGTNLPVLGAKILWWKDSFPDAFARAAKFVVIGSCIAARLGGIDIEDAFIDRTYLSFTGIADLGRDGWSSELCNLFDVDVARLPRIVPSNSIIGGLTHETAIECSLLPGTPIVAGAGDKPAGTLGAGLVSPGLIIDESASFSALSLCIDRYRPDTEHRTLENLPSPLPGLFLPSVFLNGSGLTHAWFADTFGSEERRAAAQKGASVYDVLAGKAAAVPPGSEGLIAIGLFGGRNYPNDPAIRGMWLGHSWFHRKEHFYRALLESFAYEYAMVLAVMRENYPDASFEEIRVIGGGARSALWNQIKADVLGVRYVGLSRDDCALLGDVLLAGSAVGIYDDPGRQASRFAVKRGVWEPDEHRNAHYAHYAEIYRGLFDREREVFETLQKVPSYGEKPDYERT